MNSNSSLFPSCFDALRRSPLSEDLADTAITDFLKPARFEKWPRKRAQFVSDHIETFHVIVSGRVKLRETNPETGRSITLFLLTAGDGFDIINLLDREPPASIEAVSLDDSALLTLPVDAVREWIERHPEFNRKFLPYLGKHMATLTELASDLALHDTETRLARLILRHVDRTHPAGPLRLINDLSHQALAEMIGSVRVVVNRQLHHWKQQRVIATEKGRLMIEHLSGLTEKADEFLSDHIYPSEEK